MGDKVVKLQIWDTSGQERFRTITSSYYRGAHGFLVFYDTTDHASFSNVQKWLQEIDRYACDSVTRMLVGSKDDLVSQKAVDTNEASEFADSLGLPFMECSAKTSHNIFEVFARITTEITQRVGGFSGQVVDGQERAVAADADGSDESFSEEELNTGMVSNLKKPKARTNKAANAPSSSSSSSGKKPAVRARKADTNLFRLDLSSLDSDAPLATGDPVRCGGCGAMINVLSRVVTAG